MANGNAVSEFFGNGKGKWTVLTMLLMTLAGGTSWVFSKEARDEIDGIRAYCDARIEMVNARINREVDAQRTNINERKTDVNREIDRLDDRIDDLSRLIYRGFAPR